MTEFFTCSIRFEAPTSLGPQITHGASRFTLHASRNSHGFTLLAMVGILAMMTIGAAILLPNLVTMKDQQVTQSESENLKEIALGTKAYLQANRSWPLTLATHGTEYVPFDTANLLKNPRGYSRYFALHPTMLTFLNPLGLDPSALPNARFLLISDLSTNANPIVLLPSQFDTWWNTAETKDLRIYKGNLAGMFPELNLSAAGPGGSYQIEGGVPMSSLGLTLPDYLRHHVRGTTVSLDEANIYSSPEIEFQLTTDVAYVYVPCLPAGRRWVPPPIPNCSALWISTTGNASSNPGYSNWGPSEVVAFGEPNLAYENGPTGQTSGDFQAVVDIGDFISGSANVDAAHYVNRSITVGTTVPIILNKGDILLSTSSGETLTSLNSLSVQDEDVFVFRPLTVGDYSSGTFFMLIDGSDLGLGDVKGLSLVEWDTLVGDQIVKAGSFLISDQSTDIHLFEPTSMGTVTSGSLTQFIDGSDIGISYEWYGIHLISVPTHLGDVTLQPGQILGVLKTYDNDVGNNHLADVNTQDIFLLDLTQVGSSTAGDATLFFDGSDVSLTDGGEAIDFITAYGGATGSWEQAIPLLVLNPNMELSLLGILTGWTLTGDLSNVQSARRELFCGRTGNWCGWKWRAPHGHLSTGQCHPLHRVYRVR